MADFLQTSSYVSPVYMPSPRPHIFALLIGINVYEAPEFVDLHGAVADALAFKDYLISDLEVPNGHITTLLGKEASRSGIIKAFYDLQIHPKIRKGDPIFIFFAGHGSELPTPESWRTGNTESKLLQVIVPQDYCKLAGRKVDPIPDRTLGALLMGIADKKGDNITVVFDCCHAASGTRGSTDDNPSTTLTRSVELDCTIPDNLDEDVWGSSTRGGQVHPGYQHAGLSSHVLLAACGAREKAKETRGLGEFSTALLILLRTIGPDKLKYADVLHRMYQIPSQNPQCEGVNQNRYLFDGQVRSATRPCYVIQRQDDGSIAMQAGSAHGITEQSIFAVHTNRDSIHERPLGDLVVYTLSHFSSIMAPASGLSSNFIPPPQAVAVQTMAGGGEYLRVYVRPQDHGVLSLVRNSTKYGRPNIAIIQVGHEQDAHLSISLHGENIVFRITDFNVTRYGFRQQFNFLYAGLQGDAKRLNHLLKGVAHYYWLLYQIHNQCHLHVRKCIQVEFHKLDDTQGIEQLRPIGPNLCIDNRIEFIAEDNCAYGMKLTNHGQYDFFPHVFYFDNSDLTVEMDYQPPTSGQFKSDVPLKAGESLTIGYGDGGSRPRTYPLGPGQNVEVGFFKVLVSTKPLGDLSYLTQASPFAIHRGRGYLKKGVSEIWGTLVLPVICQRHMPGRQPSIVPRHIYGGSSPSIARHPSAWGQEIVRSRGPYQILQQVSDVIHLAL